MTTYAIPISSAPDGALSGFIKVNGTKNFAVATGIAGGSTRAWGHTSPLENGVVVLFDTIFTGTARIRCRIWGVGTGIDQNTLQAVFNHNGLSGGSEVYDLLSANPWSGLWQAFKVDPGFGNVLAGPTPTFDLFTTSAPVECLWEFDAGTGAIRAKFWAVGDSEPGAWTVSKVDGTLTGGRCGFRMGGGDNISLGVYNLTIEGTPVDTTPPTLSVRTVPAGGTTLTATLSESGCTPASGTGGFTLGGTSATAGAWAISGTTFTLQVTGPIYSTDVPTLTYNRAATTDDIADAAGNFLANFSAASVTNNSTQTVPGTVATPTFSPVAGSYVGDQSITLACATSGAVNHFTTDGTTPTSASPTYSSAIALTTGTTTIKALAIKAGLTDSAVASATFVITATPPVTTTITRNSGYLSPDRVGAVSFSLLSSSGVVKIAPTTTGVALRPGTTDYYTATFDGTLAEDDLLQWFDDAGNVLSYEIIALGTGATGSGLTDEQDSIQRDLWALQLGPARRTNTGDIYKGPDGVDRFKIAFPSGTPRTRTLERLD